MTIADPILVDYGPIAKIGFRRAALALLALELARWALQARFPYLRHQTAPDVPGWIRIFVIVQAILFLIASVAAGGHIIGAIKTKSWRNLDLTGMVLYVSSWLVVGLARRF